MPPPVLTNRNPLSVTTGAVGDGMRRVSRKSHDTISMVAIDRHGNIAAGSSTNGASHKVPRPLPLQCCACLVNIG